MAEHAYSTMAEAVDALRLRGFAADFALDQKSGGMTAHGRSFRSEEMRIVEHHRFEGMSDPDDSSVVYALEAADGTRGLLIDAYGAYAEAGIGTALKAARDNHREHG